MWYRQYLRQVRRVRRQAKAQPRARLTLELEGFVALTLPTVTGTLIVPVEREVGAQVADALRERRRPLQVEAGQLRRDGGENEYWRRRTLPEATRAPPTASPAANPTDLAPPPAAQS